jgi:AGZA family xanthine/uracil permease-like MFS transporter
MRLPGFAAPTVRVGDRCDTLPAAGAPAAGTPEKRLAACGGSVYVSGMATQTDTTWMAALKSRDPWFVRGDLDGFFGLFVDNLLQLMLIGVLCSAICGFPAEAVTRVILPGAAVSILLGNLFYGWQARVVALRTGRRETTALPFGINTPSLVAYIFLIMGPVFRETGSWKLAWQAGLFATLLSGALEVAGAFAGDWLRRHTPRAALLSALAGIAITFIAMGFILQIFASPLIALLPMLLILASYAARISWPLGLPGGFLAVVVGVALAWLLRALGVAHFATVQAPYQFAVCLPQVVPQDAVALLFSETGWKYLAIILPMGLFNVIGSLQNLESAEAAGDRFETRPSLLTNGIGTVVACLLGSPFPTTIYIGHPGWKAMGARGGYSILNGAVIALLCFAGGLTLVLRVIPIECTLGILLWIAIIITAQAFQEIPKQHALAVALGLIPSFASWVLLQVETALRVAGSSLFQAWDKFGPELYVRGVVALSQGFLLSSMVLAAAMVFLIDRNFRKAAYWLFAAAALSAVGLIHAFTLTPAGVQNRFGWLAAPDFAAIYALMGFVLLGLHVWKRGKAA